MGALDEARNRLSSRRRDVRARGIRALLDLGRLDLLVEMAMQSDRDDVVTAAAEASFPEAPELLIKVLTVVRGPDAALASRYHLADGNYLYATDAILKLYRPRAGRLPIRTIEGLGLAYMQAMAPSLGRFLRAQPENLESARAREGARAVGGVCVRVDESECHAWSGRSARAFAAAVAIRRMDQNLDTSLVEPLLEKVPAAMEDCFARYTAIIDLTWALFDASRRTLDDVIRAYDGKLCRLADVATTLLKRGLKSDLENLLASSHPIAFVEAGFVYWPLVNFLETRGLVNAEEYGHHPAQPWYGYRRARLRNIAPPPWWSWR